MTDVNLNGPALKLVRTGGQALDRISAMPREGAMNDGNKVAGATAPNFPTDHRIAARAPSSSLSPGQRQQAQEKQLDQAVSRLNDYVQSVQRDLQFEVDDESGRTIVRVVDRETQEVVRQIPDELALRLAENLQQNEPLTLFTIDV